MMRLIKYTLFNLLTIFIAVDATIGITPYSEYMANLLPFYVVLLVIMSIVLIILLFFINITFDEMDDETKYRFKEKIYNVPKWRVIFNAFLDIGIAIYIAMFGFLWSAIFYLLHWVLSGIGQFSNAILKSQIDDWYESKQNQKPE